jgi:hypothetical protein
MRLFTVFCGRSFPILKGKRRHKMAWHDWPDPEEEKFCISFIIAVSSLWTIGFIAVLLLMK